MKLVDSPTAKIAKKPTGAWGTGATGPSDFAAFGNKALLPLIQDSGVYNHSASSVREYAYMEDKNFKYRPAMEDGKLALTIIRSGLPEGQAWERPSRGLLCDL